jgi:TPR repeat protein
MSSATSDTASTIKPSHSAVANTISNTLSNTVSNSSLAPPSNLDLTPEEHVTKAIALHEQGILNESTYHLRRAAKQGNPEGMLLYALACRHGWGMRPNQQEGVQWLRKAAESASLQIADEEEHIKEGKAVDYLERKTRKAQFALSIYELGVSHMNGWGIEQDKALALRCFEIAGCTFSPNRNPYCLQTN